MNSDTTEEEPLTAASTFAGDSSFGLDIIDIILNTMLSSQITPFLHQLEQHTFFFFWGQKARRVTG